MKKIATAIFLVIFLAGCSTTTPPPTVVTKFETVKVPKRYMVCKGVNSAELPVDITNLTDQEVSDVITLLYGKLITCKTNMDAVRKFVNGS
jgi:PBP1b-binding outer membrane lipoprotein LpoB